MEQMNEQPQTERRPDEWQDMPYEGDEPEGVSYDEVTCVKKLGGVVVSQSVIDVAQIREDLENLTTKKEIRRQHLASLAQVYAVAAIACKGGISMQEAATIYLESQPKSK